MGPVTKDNENGNIKAEATLPVVLTCELAQAKVVGIVVAKVSPMTITHTHNTTGCLSTKIESITKAIVNKERLTIRI